MFPLTVLGYITTNDNLQSAEISGIFNHSVGASIEKIFDCILHELAISSNSSTRPNYDPHYSRHF